MAFPRSGQGGQRRRRVLIEESLSDGARGNQKTGATPNTGERRRSSKQATAYTAEALAERQPSITALIPHRVWTLLVLLLGCLTVIAAFEAAYGNLRLWPRENWLCACRSLDLRAHGELAACFSSLMLAAAGLQSFLIFRLRRHRTDDYRGRYRLWAWIPLVWLAIALGGSTHLGEDLSELAGQVLGPTYQQAKAFWTPLAVGCLWTLLAVRLGVEVRRCWTSLVFLLMATLCYLVVSLQGAGLVTPPGEVLSVMAASTASMLGHLSVFMATAAYSRYVFLEAHGRISSRARDTESKRRKKPTAAVKTAAPTKAPVTAAPLAPAASAAPVASAAPAAPAQRRDTTPSREAGSPATQRPAAAAEAPRPKPAAPFASPSLAKPAAGPLPVLRRPVRDDEDVDDEDEEDGSHLSKAERRRLRKLGRRDVGSQQQQPQRRAA
jgi:hypothetical protein